MTLVDINDNLLNKARERITTSLQRVAKKKHAEDPAKGAAYVKDTLERIRWSTQPTAAVAKSDLVIEAIVENIEKKRELFSALDKAAAEHTIFVSNTSSLPIGEIAVSTSRHDRFGGLHFFNPVPVMKLVEVIKVRVGIMWDGAC